MDNQALAFSTSGDGNIALGIGAGNGITTASNVICIGAPGADVNNGSYIGQIFGATSAAGIAVFVNSEGKLGTNVSSRRFKDEIKPMGKVSEAILGLQPVTFLYKKELDSTRTAQFGLVAEEVEKVNPDLVVRDKKGEPYSVRYDQVNAMLLNEFLKDHRKVQEQDTTIALLKSAAARQEATIAKQQKQIEALTEGLQNVSVQVELSKAAPQTVLNRQ